MCRLFAWHSATPLTTVQALGQDASTLTELSHIHGDGWGIAFRDGDGVDRVRDTAAAHASASFARVSREHAVTDAIVHLRWATGDLAVCEPNTHPFIHDGIAFCHNGALTCGPALDALIDPSLRTELEGDTDSEQYFAALLTALGATGSMPDAYRRLLADLGDTQFSSLNALVLTADDLWVLSRNNPDRRPQGTDPDYYDLRWDVRDGVFTAWSSQVRPAVGSLLADGDLVQVHRSTGIVTIHRVH